MTPSEDRPTPSFAQISRSLETFYDGYRTPFILSMDGGGIYGLTAAIWLRQLCEQVKGFLAPGQVRVFAGCSSGAINSLLLAQHVSPREAALEGELERFWQGAGIFSNDNPFMSGQSLTAMFGTEDFLGALHDEFGDLTLGEMRHRVLISIYNWTGASAEEQKFRTPFEAAWPDLAAFLPGNLFRLGERRALETRAGQTLSHWRPKVFDNNSLISPEDRDVKVVDVAYAAACVPGLRGLRGGLGDGASFNANPAVSAIAHMLAEWEICAKHGLKMTEKEMQKDEHGEEERALDTLWLPKRSPQGQILTIMRLGDPGGPGVSGEADDSDGPDPIEWPSRRPAETYEVYREKKEEVLDKLEKEEAREEAWVDTNFERVKKWVETHGKGAVLSLTRILTVGSGQALPALAYANVDVGLNLWQSLPANPLNGILLPSSAFAVDPPATAAQYALQRLLSRERSIRLNPDLMPIPTVLAAIMAINPALRAYIVKMIYEKTSSEKSRAAVAEVAEFLAPTGDEEKEAREEREKDYKGIRATGWYYHDPTDDERERFEPGAESRQEHYRLLVRKWRKERDQRAEARRRQNPWSAWTDLFPL